LDAVGVGVSYRLISYFSHYPELQDSPKKELGAILTNNESFSIS
jgi:hypothetical protein